jgi:hypothetical protein
MLKLDNGIITPARTAPRCKGDEGEKGAREVNAERAGNRDGGE